MSGDDATTTAVPSEHSGPDAPPTEATVEPTGHPEPSPDPDTGKPSLGSLAGVMRRRTADVVAIAILVIAGLSFAGEISDWWAGEPDVAGDPSGVDGADPGWDVPGRPIEVAFGEAGVVLHRERIEGDVHEAVDRLVAKCAAVLETAEAPLEEVADGERRMLETTVDLEPVAAEPGRWSVYVVPTPMPTAVGILEDRATAAECPVCGTRRAVCWGVLMGDVEPDRWTAFWFDRRGSSPATTEQVVLPPDTRRTLSFRDTEGHGVTGFEGPAIVDELIAWFDARHSTAGGWTTSGWHRVGNVATIRYERNGRTTEVRFETKDGRVNGLLATDERR